MRPRRTHPVDYTRTCDSCALYLPETVRMNCVRVTQGDIGWYLSDGMIVSHLCDTCYFVEKLEGRL